MWKSSLQFFVPLFLIREKYLTGKGVRKRRNVAVSLVTKLRPVGADRIDGRFSSGTLKLECAPHFGTSRRFDSPQQYVLHRISCTIYRSQENSCQSASNHLGVYIAFLSFCLDFFFRFIYYKLFNFFLKYLILRNVNGVHLSRCVFFYFPFTNMCDLVQNLVLLLIRN